jgi:hypothetical protein
MAELKHGTVIVQFPQELPLIDEAGKLDPRDISRIPKPPAGLAQACYHAADSMEKMMGQFSPPNGVTPDSLRNAAQQVEKVEQVLQDLDVIIGKLRQASLMYKSAGYDQMCRLNDVVKLNGKYDRNFYKAFGKLREFFKKLGGRPATPDVPEVSNETAGADNAD